MEENAEFVTQDITFAAYLRNRGVRLHKIEAISLFRSRFTFDAPSEHLVNEWLTGNTNERIIIDTYRHLVRDARAEQDKLR